MARMVRFSKSNCSGYSFFSPSSSGHRFNYGRNPEGSMKFYSSIPFKASERISLIVKPDGEGGYYVDQNALLRSLRNDCMYGAYYKQNKLAEKEKEPRPWLRDEAKKNQQLVGKSKFHLDKEPLGVNPYFFGAYLEASSFDMPMALVSISAFCAFSVGTIELVLRM